MVRFRRRLVVLPAALLLPLAAATPASASRTSVVPRHAASAPRRLAAAPTYTIGVDNASPPGHNFEYTDFFPNVLNAHQGDTIDFTWNQGSADGFHTVALFKTGSSALNYGLLTAEPGGDETGSQLNPLVLAPSLNAAACGTAAANACIFDGSSGAAADLLSGAVPTGLPQPNHFIVQLAIGLTPGAYKFACLIHPGRMNGTINVFAPGPGADSTAAVAARAAAQLSASTTAALAAESAANTTTATKNANGTNTWTATAGTAPASQPVEVLEMLPANIPIQPGDSVKWTTNTQQGNEIHTVTFPDAATVANPGPVNATNPIPFVCEAGAAADTPAPFNGPPPNFGCAAPAENAWSPGPQGATSIATGSTVGSSGIITNQPPPPLAGQPNNFTFTFPKNGSFSFMCHIHAHMFGTVFTHGYRSVASDGGIFTHGNTDFFGSQGGKPLNQPIVGAAATPDQQGYYEVASDGGIFTFGDAVFQGSMGGKHLNKPIVGMGVTPDGGGYYEVASDGGIFTFGDAVFQGSMGGNHLNKPVVGVAVTPTGLGYYEVASDGGIFTFGDAGFQGSEGGTVLNKPIVGMAATSDGGGYWEVASDGGIFTFGTAGFFGSEGAIKLNKPIVGMQATTDDGGYRLVATDGGIFTHGDATFAGSEGGTPLTLPVVGITGS